MKPTLTVATQCRQTAQYQKQIKVPKKQHVRQAFAVVEKGVPKYFNFGLVNTEKY